MEPDKMELERLQLQAADAVRELLEKARVPRGGIVVVGCSTSEVAGGSIGKASSSRRPPPYTTALHPCWRRPAFSLPHSAANI